MIPSFQIVYPEYTVINFMQENCSFHTSNHTMEWISQHPVIEILDNWPPNSPDMNPIEGSNGARLGLSHSSHRS